MKTQAEQWRLALLIVHYQCTLDFTDKGATALSRWYEEFLATEGENLSEPLDLSDNSLKTLPDLVCLPLSLGVPYVKLGNNPDLVDLRELQNLPLITKLGTIEQAIIAEKSAPTILLLHEIRNAMLGSKTTLKLSMADVAELPVYIQLLSNLEELELDPAIQLNNLRTLNNLNSLRKLVLKMPFNMPNLKSLTNLPRLKRLNINNASGRNEILQGVENLTSLEEIFISRLEVDSIDNLRKLPNLKTLTLYNCDVLQRLQRLHEFPTLNNIELLGSTNLQEISIDEPNDHLEDIGIYGADRLVAITGINYLNSVKKIRIYNAENLQNLTGIEAAVSLKHIEIRSSNLAFLKQTLKHHIDSGRYKTFKIIDHSQKETIDLLTHNPTVGEILTIQLLANNLAAVPLSSETAAIQCSELQAVDSLQQLIYSSPEQKSLG